MATGERDSEPSPSCAENIRYLVLYAHTGRKALVRIQNTRCTDDAGVGHLPALR